MSAIQNLQTKMFLTNLELIARKDLDSCIAVLYNDEKNVIICKGMQADLLYWFSQRFSPQPYKNVFDEILSTYEVEEEQLHQDLKVALTKMIELKLISII